MKTGLPSNGFLRHRLQYKTELFGRSTAFLAACFGSPGAQPRAPVMPSLLQLFSIHFSYYTVHVSFRRSHDKKAAKAQVWMINAQKKQAGNNTYSKPM